MSVALARELGMYSESPKIPLSLAPFVRSWMGYEERTAGPCVRRELPWTQVVLIVEFAPPVKLFDGGSETEPA